jgi:hypothetical protein
VRAGIFLGAVYFSYAFYTRSGHSDLSDLACKRLVV